MRRMPFPRRLLNDGEEIILDRNPHALALIGPVALLVVGAVAGGLVAKYVNPGDGDVNGWINWATLIVPAIALGRFIAKFIRWRTTNFVVTTDRLVYRHGVIAKKGMEIPLERINNISSSQTIFERLIGSGDLLIESGGENGQQRFTDVKKPFEVQATIYKQIERSAARDMDRMAGRRELSIPEQIEKLADLAAKGVLTPAEFEAKKSQLLGKL
jgi:uncharacterized membrane protein YdbT with pleckstrin-like domain